MKKLFFFLFLLVSAAAWSQDGYEIKVTLKPFYNQYIYLGHYFGKSYPIIDSAMTNNNGEATFKGNKKLNGGIYLIGFPNKAGFFEILIDKNQRFSIKADSASIDNKQFINSKDNELFTGYQAQMSKKGKRITELQKQLKEAKNPVDSINARKELEEADKEIAKFREDLIKDNPNSILTTLLVAMREPELKGELKQPKTHADSVASYEYFKIHFWDGVNFWDGRLAYTTFFEDKLDKYFNQLVVPHPDSVIKEIDRMLGFAAASEEMNRFLLIKFVNRYLNQKYMWEDAVFVHLYEKYFSNKKYSWLTEKGEKTITDRAYSLMANIMGTPAHDIELPDSSGRDKILYDLKSEFTLVVFWDATCGHCKEVLPTLDSFYNAKWKGFGLKIYSIAKETDGTTVEWKKFIKDHSLVEWTHVYYSKASEKTRIDSNIPGYSQLYDVQSFPTLYLLDKDKRIIAKKLTPQQLDNVLEIKRKG